MMKKACLLTIVGLLLVLQATAMSQTITPFQSNAFIRDWLICGPFPNEPGAGMATDFLVQSGGETGIKPVAGLAHAGAATPQGIVAWQPVVADASGKLDFVRYLSPNQNNVAYAAAIIRCDQKTHALLKTGSNDRLKLWLNGKEIYQYPDVRAGGPDADHIQVQLHKGDNLLLAKVDQAGGSWWLYSRLESLFAVDDQIFVAEPMVSPVSKKIDDHTVTDLFSLLVYNVSSKPSGPTTLQVLADSGRPAARVTIPSIPADTSAWLIVPSNADLQVVGSRLSARLKISTSHGHRTMLIAQDRRATHDHADLQIFIIPHSHADLCWPDTPEACTTLNCQAISQSIDILSAQPDFKFSEEDVFVLEEFLRRNPQRYAEVGDLLRNGVLECGGFYFGPSELLLGGEGLIRNIYYGKLWLQNQFNYDARMAWNVDEPGHTLQMPQILAKSGIDHFVIWKTLYRWENNLNVTGYVGPNLFHWQAPDGSKILVTSCPQGYGAGHMLRTADFLTASKEFQHFVRNESWHNRQWNLPPVIMMADGSDCTIPDARVGKNAGLWNQLYGYPHLELAHVGRYTEAVETALQQGRGELQTLQGELPCWWDGTQSVENDAFMLSRKTEHLVLSAEKFSTLLAWLDVNHEYPVRAIDHIWKGRLWVHEHNWGGTNGRISDAVKLARAREGYRLADEGNRDALAALAGAVSVQNRGVPLVVFNSLAWPRRDIVDPIVSLAEPGQREPRLVDGSGRTVAAQFNVLARHADGSIARIRTIFTADAPALGYATFYLSQGKESTPNPFKISDHEIENRFYRVRLDPRTGGIASIYDKQNQREWIKSDVYRAHELVAMENLGVDEAEEFTEKWWRMDEKPVAVTMTERGPVRTTFRIEGTLLNSRTIQTISLYADLPRIDLETRLNWNGQKAIQVNAAFPFHLPNGRVTYEVPFGDVEYGQENPAAKACHPTVRAANNWIDLSNEEMGITLATEVTPFDLKDRRDERFRDARVIQGIAAPDTFHIFWGGAYTPFTRVALTDPILLQTDFVIQPILLRSVFSCGDANLYFTQPGEHVYRFSITTHPGALVRHEATRQGLEHNAPLQVVCVKAGSGTRADSASFISVSQPNVIVSVVKKAEKGKGLVLRCYETDGQDAQVTMAFAKPVRAAWHTDLIERDGKPAHIVNGRLVVAIGRHAIETYRLVFE